MEIRAGFNARLVVHPLDAAPPPVEPNCSGFAKPCVGIDAYARAKLLNVMWTQALESDSLPASGPAEAHDVVVDRAKPARALFRRLRVPWRGR